MYEIFLCLVVIWIAYVLSLFMFLIINGLAKIGNYIVNGKFEI